jgi:hypothetical protein
MEIFIQYGNFKFISESGYPVPKATIAINNKRTASEIYIGSTKTINLDGIIYRGLMKKQYGSTPSSSDSSSSGLLDQAIKFKNFLLNQPGKEPRVFTITANSIPIVSGSGYINSINFDTSDNRAVNSIKYTVGIELYDTQTGINTANSGIKYNVSSVNDSYEIETKWDKMYSATGDFRPTAMFLPTFNISRTLSANGLRGVSGALNEAIRWVNDRQQYFPFTGIFPTAVFPLFNHNRSLDINESAGTVNIKDTFLCKTSGDPWIDTCNISTSVSENFNRDIKIQGKIEGLHKFNNLQSLTGNLVLKPSGEQLLFPLLSGSLDSDNTKYTNALSGYLSITGSIFNRALIYDSACKNLVYNTTTISTNFPNYNQKALNPIPMSVTEGLSPIRGEIEYSYTYNSRPQAIITGALAETINLNDNGPSQRILNTNVMGRRLGPVVYFYTYQSGVGERTVSYEGVFQGQTAFKKFKVDSNILRAIESYILQFKPSSPFTGLITSNTTSLNMSENRIRRSITWQYTKCADG